MIEPFYYDDYSNYSNLYSDKNKKKNKKKINLDHDEDQDQDNDKIPELITIQEEEQIEIDHANVKINELNNNCKQYILNPLTVIIKLSILSCKPIGTKIHIQNNTIYFQEPGIFQGLTRYIFKSDKSQLQYIYNPIKIACKNYLSKEFIINTPNIVNIFMSAKKGLEKLIKTYASCSITILCLKYYYVIITNYINQSLSLNEILKEPIFNDDNDLTKKYYTKDLINKLENQWNISKSKLKIILDLMDFLLNQDINENQTNNIKSLENIINNNDQDTQKIISESI
jgi:hypothetical protein